MVGKENLKGIFSALVTPFDEQENVRYDLLDLLIEKQLTEGVEGFYLCGSSGEGLLLTIEERKKILERVLKTVEQRVPVIAHIGTIRSSDVISLAKHAEEMGASAVSMIPPYYYRFSLEEIIEYYEAVIRTTREIGVIIYNIPQFTGFEFNKQNAGKLFENDRILGIKHTSTNLYNMERMHAAYPEKILYNGFDEQFLGALTMGAQATVGTTVNVFAPLFREIRDHYQAGNLQQGFATQRILNEKIEVMLQAGIFNAVKYLFHKQGIPCGWCRAPFLPPTEEQKTLLDELL